VSKYLLILFLIFSCSSHQNEQLNSKRNPSSSDESPWTDWSNKKSVGAMLVLKNIRENLLENHLHDPYVSYGYRKTNCTEDTRYYRSADGTCTNWEKPIVGASNVAFGRNISPDLITDEKAAGTLLTPSPRLVSKTFFTREGPEGSYKPVPFLNMIAASWIQFMNHDWITHGKNVRHVKGVAATEPYKLANGFEVERTQVDPTNNANYKKEYKKTTLNKVTHWWDGSQIYGSNLEEQKRLRVQKFRSISNYSNFNYDLMDFGKIRVGPNGLLPKENKLNPQNQRQNQGYELTGFMDNWWVGLSMLHHLFVKEHNAIASMLMEEYVHWNGKSGKWAWDTNKKKRKKYGVGNLKVSIPFTKQTVYEDLNDKQLDEKLFQLARLINSAIMAKIHTVEWTPAILANKTLDIGMHANWYGLSNPKTISVARGTNNGITFKPRTKWENFKYKIKSITDWTPIKSGYLVGGIVGDKSNDHGVPYSLSEEFTSVYRLHSLLPENLELKKTRRDSNNKITGVEMFNTITFDASRNEKSYGLLEKHSLSDLFYSFGTQKPGQLVLNNFPKFMQNLDIPKLGKMDLGAVDILRDRERGVPRYNQFRRGISLKPISKYTDFFPNGVAKTKEQKNILKKFETVYGFTDDGKDNVEAIDLLVGTLAEEVRPEGFGFGETPFQIFILMASRRLMADRFYTDDYRPEVYTKAGLKWIDREGTMHQVIARHMPALAEKMEGARSAFAPWKD